MREILPGLLRKSCWGLSIFVLATTLPACLAVQKGTSLNETGADASAVEKETSSMDVHPYVYNRPHQVPADYVYRTERIFPPPPAQNFSLKTTVSNENRAESLPPASASPGKANADLFVERVHDLVSQLLGTGGEAIEDDQRVLVSSFVNLNDLYKTSALGRVIGEQVVNELQRAGIDVLDVRKTPAILVNQKSGEFGLSRDMEELPYIHEAHATVVGTYSEAAGQLFVNARILRNSDGLVMASGSMVLEKNALFSSLLGDEAGPVERRLSTVQMEAQ